MRLLCLLLWLIPLPALAQDRVALVIANAAYEHTSPLVNPPNDAEAMAAALTDLGYVVERIDDASLAQMTDALLDFGDRAAEAQIAVIFYSGHGMAINRDNYLIPVEATLTSARRGRGESVPLARLREAAREAARLSVVIIDACRNDRFPSEDRGLERTMARVRSRPGEVVAFSTAPGQTAADGEGDLSPFTDALTRRLRDTPDEDVRVLFTSLELTGVDQTPFAEFGRMPRGLLRLGGATPADIARARYGCVTESGERGVRFGGRCWRLDSQRLGYKGPATDLSPLVGLTELRGLSLENVRVADLSPLAEMTTLRELSLSSTPVTDLSPLAGMTELQTLELSYTPVTDLDSLVGMIELYELNIEGTFVTDLSPLAEIKGLKRLNINATAVSDLSPLMGMTQMERLDMRYTPVTDLSPLIGITRLRKLDLTFAPVTDLSPLIGMNALQTLELSYTPVTDLLPLTGLNGLENISLHSTPITTLFPLAEMSSLQEVNIRATPISDLSPLAEMVELRRLMISMTQIANLSPLSALNTLHYLETPDGEYYGHYSHSTPETRAEVAAAIRDWRLEE